MLYKQVLIAIRHCKLRWGAWSKMRWFLRKAGTRKPAVYQCKIFANQARFTGLQPILENLPENFWRGAFLTRPFQYWKIFVKVPVLQHSKLLLNLLLTLQFSCKPCCTLNACHSFQIGNCMLEIKFLSLRLSYVFYFVA